MKSTIFIPKKCKVGFNTRNDTYTGKLAYVIYNDGKVWRKETSWNGWIENYISEEDLEVEKLKAYNRDIDRELIHAKANNGKVMRWLDSNRVEIEINSREDVIEKLNFDYSSYIYRIGKTSTDPSIKPFEFDNEPIEGFVLNKKAGGTSSGWNTRQTYCRIYDPRGFEFEVTIPNLLYILENANSIKGKGLEGKFVYGWEGKDLVLIPESAPEYQDLIEYTNMQSNNIKKSELVLGGVYIDTSNEKRIYLGEGYEKNYQNISSSKKLWFSNVDSSYICTRNIKSIKKYTGEISNDFANLVDKLEKDKNYMKEKPEFELIVDANNFLKNKLDTNKPYECWATNTETKIVGVSIYKTIRNKYYNYIGKDTLYIVYGKIKPGHSRYNEYKTIDELTKELKLWQLKTTK